MSRVYLVKHRFEVDGGFGDGIERTETVVAFTKEEVANRFVDTYSNPHVYAKPYQELSCGELFVESFELLDDFKEDDYKWVDEWHGESNLVTKEDYNEQLRSELEYFNEHLEHYGNHLDEEFEELAVLYNTTVENIEKLYKEVEE